MKLVEVIERSGNHLKKIKLGEGDVVGVYYSISEAARLWGVARITGHRWYESGRIEGVVVDEVNGHLYVPEKTVERLKPENRMVRIS